MNNKSCGCGCDRRESCKRGNSCYNMRKMADNDCCKCGARVMPMSKNYNGCNMKDSCMAQNNERCCKVKDMYMDQNNCGCKMKDMYMNQDNCGCKMKDMYMNQNNCGCKMKDMCMNQNNCGCKMKDMYMNQNDCGCKMPKMDCIPDFADDVDCLPLGMAYVPFQKWDCNVSDACKGLSDGTIFPELVLPFICTPCNRGRSCM